MMEEKLVLMLVLSSLVGRHSLSRFQNLSIDFIVFATICP